MRTLGIVLSIAALVGMVGAPPVALAGMAGQATIAGTGAAVPPAAAEPVGNQATVAESVDDARLATACAQVEVLSTVFVRRFGGSPVVGAVQLRRDSCSRYWAQVTLYDPLPAHALATAYLTRYDRAGQVSRLWCDGGGTEAVAPGQRTCRTAKVRAAGAGSSFIASAQELHNGGAGYAKVSWGQTDRTR